MSGICEYCREKCSWRSAKWVMLAVAGIVLIALCFIAGITNGTTEFDVTETAAKLYLEKTNTELSIYARRNVDAEWNYESNLTDYNLQNKLEISKQSAEFDRRIWEEVQRYPWGNYSDTVRRQFQKLAFLGDAALPAEKFEKFSKIKAEMVGIYAKATVCDFTDRNKCDLHLEPEITDKVSESKNEKELEHLWVAWRNASGRQSRQLFKEYVSFENEVAVKNNFTDAAAMWLKDYEDKDFEANVEELLQQLMPMYKQFHAYVRRKLREQYGEEVVPKTEPIPAHLLGNVWAQTWESVERFGMPYPNKPSLNVTPALIEQKYTPTKIFKLAEEFFVSLNLSAMPQTFWENSILEKPKDGRELVCHASAWDFYDAKEFSGLTTATE